MATDTLLVPSELLAEPLLLVTIDGVIEVCNDAFAALCGVPSANLRGKRMESLISEHLAEYLRVCARSDKPLPASFTLRSKAGASQLCFYGFAHRAQGEPSPPRVVLVLRRVVEQDDARAALAQACGVKQPELPSACRSIPRGRGLRHDFWVHKGREP